MTCRSKRRSRRRGARPIDHHQEAIGNPGAFIGAVFLDTVASLVPEMVCKPELRVLVAGRYEVRVGNGFQPVDPDHRKCWKSAEK